MVDELDASGGVPDGTVKDSLRMARGYWQAKDFKLHSLGIASNRDKWTFDFDENTLSDKAYFFCRAYRNEMQRFIAEQPEVSTVSDWVDRSIKWTAELEAHLVKGNDLAFTTNNIVSALYRPFVVQHCYYAPIITHRRYQQPQIFPHNDLCQNIVICFPGIASNKPFSVLATNRIFSLDLLEKTQCLPLCRYTPNGGQVSNITEWGLQQFQQHYGDDSITAEDIFAYTYAVLHDPAYREKYAVDLLREFPRLPFYPDFPLWTRMGQDLLDLHVGFESAEPYPLEGVEQSAPPGKAVLRAEKERGVASSSWTARHR